MKNKRNIAILVFLMFFLNSCGAGDAAKVLRNEKITNTDEFLVKKREPLVLPPDYKDLPEPGSLGTSTQNDQKTIDKILKIKDSKQQNKDKSSSVEQSILNRITK